MAQPRTSWRAILLALVTPGLGQLYVGKPRLAVIAFVAVYCAITCLAFVELGGPSGPTLAIAFVLALAVGIAPIVHAGVTAARAPSPFLLRGYNRWWVYLGIFLIVAFLWQPSFERMIRTRLVQAFRIPSSAMEPSILVGDYLFADRRTSARHRPSRNDVVIFGSVKQPGVTIIKRVVGLPGDSLAMVAGRLVRNGTPIVETWTRAFDSLAPVPLDEGQLWHFAHLLRDTSGYHPTMKDWGPLVVPPESVFVLGDNRPNSYDSRFWGAVPLAGILGRPVSIYLSIDREYGIAIRWRRIGRAPWMVSNREDR